MSHIKKPRTRTTPSKSSSFTIGKPNPDTEKKSISVLENSEKQSFVGAILDYLRYVSDLQWDLERVSSMLDIDDRDVFSVNFNKSLIKIGISVKLYRYNNTSANLMYIAQYGISPNVAYIVVQDTQKFSLISSMYGIVSYVENRMCTLLHVNQYIDPAFVTPVKEKHSVTPTAPIKRSQQTDENSETPRIETVFRQSFEHNEQYIASKVEQEVPQLADRLVLKPKKRSKRDQFLIACKRINNDLTKQQLCMEQCIDVIAKLAETLAKNAQKATKKSESQTQHERRVQIDLSNGLIEQLFAKKEDQKIIQRAIDVLVSRKKDMELFLGVLEDSV